MIFKVLLFYIVLFVPCLVENKLTLRVKGLKCIAIDDQYVKFNLCEVKPINRFAFEASIYARIHQKPIDNAMMTIKIYKRGFEHLRPIYDLTVDICAFLKNKRRNPIASIFFQIFGFLEYSNINHTCSFNHDLILHKYRWNDSYIQLLPIPVATYAIYTNWTVSNKHRAKVNVYPQILEK